MKIAVDTRWANIRAGVGNQIHETFQHLCALDQENHYTFFGVDLGIKQSNVRLVKLEGVVRKAFQGLWKTIRLPSLERLTGQQDLVHFTNMVSIPLKNKQTKTVVTVHDLAFTHVPETIEAKNLRFLNKFARPSIERADHIIAVSQATKKDLIQTFQVDASKVTVIENAGKFNVKEDLTKNAQVKATYQLPEKFILFVGTLEPRKNLQTLLKAYEQSAFHQEFALVLIGASGWKSSPLRSQIEKMRSGGYHIITPGYVHDEELEVIYSLAAVFVFPSMFEGFGIPVVDAMRCKTPVIAANNSSLPEAVGEAGLLFETMDTEDLKKKLDQVLGDNALQEDMIKKGSIQAQRFDWGKSAQKTLDVYQNLLQSE